MATVAPAHKHIAANVLCVALSELQLPLPEQQYQHQAAKTAAEYIPATT
jgi:hypothetical protein